MKKKTQYYLYLLLIALLTIKYTHASFTNVKITKLASSEMDEDITTKSSNLNNDKSILFENMDEGTKIFVCFKKYISPINNYITMEFFVLKVNENFIPKIIPDLNILTSCRANIKGSTVRVQ